MPPKIKITKEEIIAASLEIVRESGAEALNARAVAKRLNCSTQPIFSNYSIMEELKQDVIQAANELYQKYITEGMKDPNCPPYKASGLSYIRFAKEEKELFKLLFMRDRSKEKMMQDEKGENEAFIQIISKNTGLSLEEAFLFHIKMWIYVHGIATMVATSYLDWDWDFISQTLSEAYQSMKIYCQNNKK